MRRPLPLITFILAMISGIALLSLYGCRQQHNSEGTQKSRLHQLNKEISNDLTNNLLPYWSTIMIDTVNGGVYGKVDANELIYPEADKGGILNARILWTFSSAYRVLQDTTYLNIATYAMKYIMDHFIDRGYGGAFQAVKYNGEPSDTRKQTLTQSYFIYALAEYYRATGDHEALDEAIEIFEALEKYAFDKEFNGYFEVYTREWKRSSDLMLGERSSEDEKTMITHLHLVEAYAGLYRVWPDKRMQERLRNVLEVFIDRIVDKETGHLHYFLDREWNPTTAIDSYGHDIEASWLIDEAARLLEDPELIAKVKKLSVRIADAAAEGIMDDGSMLTEKNNETGHVVTVRSWWEQAESVVGYLNAYEISGKNAYLDIAIKSWEYIKDHFIDYEHGGWHRFVMETGEPGTGNKADSWTCPYHNGRMCLEVIERIGE